MENEQPVGAPKKASPIVVVVLVAVILGAVAFVAFTTTRQTLQEVADGLEGGTPAAQVIDRLGEPAKKQPLGTEQELWTYSRSFPRREQVYLVFEKDGTFLYATEFMPE